MSRLRYLIVALGATIALVITAVPALAHPPNPC
jgi:hypothetical protein